LVINRAAKVCRPFRHRLSFVTESGRRGFPIGLAGEGRPTQHAQICPWASAGSKLAISSCPPRSCAIRRIGGTATWTTERSFAEIKIGRASWRERGEEWGGAVRVEGA